ncbi:hypothetical protein HPB51_012041 [Rhipicephalus microplus]|uniref:Proteasome activator PA28 C-terminal domain-containing protein n=1 Tax=Rhipicephalus microplus TaxID=6941 RepID=A0A9J6F1L8_RHIMP|nr:hypothetical protein HPB51_012041 [Rhipicephalus microplus]
MCIVKIGFAVAYRIAREDFRRTVQELDEKQYVSLRLVLCELKNHYATLHDLITKNLEKIKRPRSSNAENMY